jgi:hypothetical protein
LYQYCLANYGNAQFMDEVIIPKFVVDSRILHQLIDWGLSDEIIPVFTAFQSYQKNVSNWYRISSIRIG